MLLKFLDFFFGGFLPKFTFVAAHATVIEVVHLILSHFSSYSNTSQLSDSNLFQQFYLDVEKTNFLSIFFSIFTLLWLV